MVAGCWRRATGTGSTCRLKEAVWASPRVQLLEAHAAAPGKVILFGEHAVVYGEPSLSLAINKRTRVSGQAVGDAFTVNGFPLDAIHHSYIQKAVGLHWRDGPVRLQTESDIPSGSGVGSSAALCVGVCAVLLRLQSDGPVSPEAVARAAFQSEFETQGAASPNDTTVATAGGGVLLSPTRIERPDVAFLWQITREARAWNAHRVNVPKLPLVVGHSGSKGNTAEQVAKVRRFVERSGFARDIIKDMGRITMEGVDALRRGDLRAVGDLMNRAHSHLHTLGVDTPKLGELVAEARRVPGTLGAKITGAGGGGSMLVLTERPDEVRFHLERLGARAFLVEPAQVGVEVRP